MTNPAPSAAPSALLTLVNRTFDGLDTAALAESLDLAHADLARVEPTVGAALAAGLTDSGATLIRGTGALAHDARVAAALGVPLLLVIDDAAGVGRLAVAEAEAAGAVVAATLTATELADAGHVRAALAAVADDAKPVMSPEVFERRLAAQAAEVGARIVLPEGDDDRILAAADQLLKAGVARLTILGDPQDVAKRAKDAGLDLSDAEVVDHRTDPRREEFAAEFARLREKKGVTLEQAREQMDDVSYFGTMLVHTGAADGMVSGAAHTTAETIRPALQIIRTSPEASVVSSIFLMVLPGKLWAFGDCAVNPNPTAEQLGEIAVVSARTAAGFGIDPKVAVLSYSSGASGSGADVERAVTAVETARKADPQLAVDGPLQFDAACDPGVAAKKMPDSPVAGQANVFVFPDLEAGNIGYKAVQRTAGALAVGPILQGLNKPVNDLSRGATVPDIVNTVAITAIQAGGNR
ncbi:phosphate acetyltransferase [Corynebacterium frankenforstense]|uniref:phosphate acetyltransferase n=1 Tax=Corynebacterium frankenforstense TaxID=1230998 RepID=UPI0026F27566|nr:phosphate acetyltransferase [Corynebacterium frankenforstense]